MDCFLCFPLSFWNNLHPFPRPEVLYSIYLWGPFMESDTLPTGAKGVLRGSDLNWWWVGGGAGGGGSAGMFQLVNIVYPDISPMT